MDFGGSSSEIGYISRQIIDGKEILNDFADEYDWLNEALITSSQEIDHIILYIKDVRQGQEINSVTCSINTLCVNVAALICFLSSTSIGLRLTEEKNERIGTCSSRFCDGFYDPLK